MKPLVYYCRWQGAKLRLRGRDETAVWGQFSYPQAGGGERMQEFSYELQTATLKLQSGAHVEVICLDEMGVAKNE